VAHLTLIFVIFGEFFCCFCYIFS